MDLWKRKRSKLIQFANVDSQVLGEEYLVALVKYAGESAARTRESVLPAVVDKCFGSARSGTKLQALELSLQYVEMENSGAGVAVCFISSGCLPY